MKLDTIGKNIRKFRLARKLRQEDLAEKTDLTTNYIGMVERGEKIPSLETFIKIVNALGVSSDMVLTDVLETGYTVKNSMLNEKLEKLAPEDRNRIYEVIDTLVYLFITITTRQYIPVYKGLTVFFFSQVYRRTARNPLYIHSKTLYKSL